MTTASGGKKAAYRLHASRPNAAAPADGDGADGQDITLRVGTPTRS